MFVVAPRSALCPTREQAAARDCGHSVESVDQGTRAPLGRAVTVVGEGPIDGMWKALRFQKAGTLPSWIAAEDVAETPNTDALTAFEQHPDLGKAKDAATLSGKQLGSLRKGTRVHWKRTRAAKFGSSRGEAFIYLDLGDAGAVAIQLPATEKSSSYIENHTCLIYGDCLRLAYLCDDTYCDEVSILARATGKKVAPPEDQESEWTAGSQRMPVFELISIADRFGTFPK
jgi:hypothetical protein